LYLPVVVEWCAFRWPRGSKHVAFVIDRFVYLLVTLFEKLEFAVQVYRKYRYQRLGKVCCLNPGVLSKKSGKATLVVAAASFCETLVPVDYQSTRRGISSVRTAHAVVRE